MVGYKNNITEELAIWK